MRPPSRLLRASLALLTTCILACGGQSKHAIAGAVTGASAVTVNLTGAATRTTTTDGTGGYAFTGLADGAYTVTPEKTGYTFTPASLAVTVSGADVAGQDFAAAPVPHAIAGAVTGASAVTVNLTGAATRTTTTDGAGGSAFTGLADGAYTVTPEKTGYTFTPASLAVTVSGVDVAGQDFVATLAPYAISGLVLTDYREGVTLFTMTLSGAATATTTTHFSPKAGQPYAFTGLTDGEYVITPVNVNYTFSPSSRTVTVSGADVTDQDFVATRRTITLAGTVTGADAVSVVVYQLGNDLGLWFPVASTTTDASGHYSCTVTYVHPRIFPYTYRRVRPSKAGYTFAPEYRSVGSGGSQVNLDFTGTPVAP